MSTKNLEIGSTVGDYKILAVLGRGGMGRVFKVQNIISDRVEALKSLLPYHDSSPELTDRFIREIKVLAKLDHGNITSLRTAFRAGEELVMIFEYVEGSSLDRKIKAGKLEVPKAVHYTCQALDALSYAHHSGVFHRDVKPSNILISRSDIVKITDFGIASLVGDPGLTLTGRTLGTLYYMSPEQIKAEPLDARSDLYSVGVTLYEMVTGTVPVQGESYYAILRAHLEKRPMPATKLAPEVPEELSIVIDKSLEKDPRNRFQSADEFRGALQSLNIPKYTSSSDIATATIEAAVAAAELKTPPHGSKSWDSAVLENARKHLAAYIGPMAKVIVGRALK